MKQLSVNFLSTVRNFQVYLTKKNDEDMIAVQNEKYIDIVKNEIATLTKPVVIALIRLEYNKNTVEELKKEIIEARNYENMVGDGISDRHTEKIENKIKEVELKIENWKNIAS